MLRRILAGSTFGLAVFLAGYSFGSRATVHAQTSGRVFELAFITRMTANSMT